MNAEPNRRRFLQAHGAVLAGVAIGGVSAAPARAGEAWEPVPPVDLSALSPDLFADTELDLPYYLAHLHRLANSVLQSGDDRGFISLPVYQDQDSTVPENIRVMENIISLAYFYVSDRPWNPYRHLEHYSKPQVIEKKNSPRAAS